MIYNEELNLKGFTVLRNAVERRVIDKLRKCAYDAFDIHKTLQIRNNSEIIINGVALHAILNDNYFLEFFSDLIQQDQFRSVINNFFGSKFIMNSFSALNNIPNDPNFSSIIHRDIKFFSGTLPLMVNVLIMVDDFTIENGATIILPYSHMIKEKPSDEFFHTNSIQATGNSGDILIFNSNIWHCSGKNSTDKDRIGLPITFSKSSLKQLLDYPRALGYNRKEEFNDELRQILGYDARIAENLDQWYQPFENRFYKKNQD